MLALPDQEIRTAIQDAGVLYLAFDYGTGSLQSSADLRRRILGWLDAEPARWDQPPHKLFEQIYAELEVNVGADLNRQREAVVVATVQAGRSRVQPAPA